MTYETPVLRLVAPASLLVRGETIPTDDPDNIVPPITYWPASDAGLD